MSKEKSWVDLHENEVLSDNTGVENCKICKDCLFRSDGTIFSNHYTKANCVIYRYPGMKPLRIIDNEGPCEYYHKDEDE